MGCHVKTVGEDIVLRNLEKNRGEPNDSEQSDPSQNLGKQDTLRPLPQKEEGRYAFDPNQRTNHERRQTHVRNLILLE